VFATALGKNQPDRSYYKSLYKFDPKVELTEYSLPFYDNATGKSVPSAVKLPSGVLNAAKLPPLGKEEQHESPHAAEVPEEQQFERNEEEKVHAESASPLRNSKRSPKMSPRRPSTDWTSTSSATSSTKSTTP
jgi:hypothetical protein